MTRKRAMKVPKHIPKDLTLVKDTHLANGSYIASIGHAANMYRLGVKFLVRELEVRGVRPCLVVDGIHFYNCQDLEYVMFDLAGQGKVPPRDLHLPPVRVEFED